MRAAIVRQLEGAPTPITNHMLECAARFLAENGIAPVRAVVSPEYWTALLLESGGNVRVLSTGAGNRRRMQLLTSGSLIEVTEAPGVREVTLSA